MDSENIYVDADNLYKKTLLKQGDAYYKAKKYWNALIAYSRAIRLDHDYADAYVGKGDCLRELKSDREALECYDQAIALDPQNVSAYIGKADIYTNFGKYDGALALYMKAGSALLNLGCFEQALEVYNKALQLNSQLAQVHAGRGHALFALNRSIDALKSYGEAIHLHTDDVYCYLNSGEILTGLHDYKEATQMYEQALWLEPELVSAHVGRGNALFELKYYLEALAAYKQVITLDVTNIAAYAYVRIGDILTILNTDEEAAEFYEKALKLIQGEQNLDFLWSLTNPTRASFRPADVQFELLQHFIISASVDTRTNEALKNIGVLYAHLFDSQRIPLEKLQMNVRKLARVLESLPDARRSEALLLIANGKDLGVVHLLIVLAPYSLSGLGTLAHDLTLRLKPEPREDELFIRFYHVLDSYGVPFEDSDWLFARELVGQRLYIQAKSILNALVNRRPTPDNLWLFAQALKELKEAPHSQIETLQRFIDITPASDIRRGHAWKRIGELYEKQLSDGIDAIRAYEQAELYGFTFQQLQDFRTGNWEAIPTLRTHSDFVFPPVIVIDLESDYQPDAPPGSCVFEIGAVCRKGGTELDTYHAIIWHDIVSPKVAHRQREAKPLEQVVKELQAFIEKSQQSVETAIFVGHNLEAFDALHLRAMGILISDDQIIDTLTFARLLYPDSLHHHLELLCNVHNIPFQGKSHTALPDARACAHLLHALGDELVCRGERLFAGFRAFVPPDSVFDRAVLQPRNIAADPTYSWELDPTPTTPRVLAAIKDMPASPRMLEAFNTKTDALIECYDPNAIYVQHLPANQRSIVTVSARMRLERILVASPEGADLFVLPDPRTLLCPYRLGQHIKQAENYQMKLMLFCLYQVSHNHDARTLYPLRIPPDETTLTELKQILIASCCESDWYHSDSCPAILAAKKAADTSNLLLVTHESFLHQKYQLGSDVIIVDDADELQMHFAEYLAERVAGEQLFNWSVDVCKLLEAQISKCINGHISTPGFHERLPLHSIVPYLTQPQDRCDKSLLTLLKEVDPIGETIASKLEGFRQASALEATDPENVHAYWLDLQISHKPEDSSIALEQLSFCGLNRDLRQAFEEAFWQPYKQHIICGTAITLGASQTTFLKRFFGLPDDIAFLADERPSTQVYIPTADIVRPSSFLGRRSWAESAGAFLYRLALSSRESFVVTLHPAMITDALADSFKPHEEQVGHQILSLHLGWTTAKIADRLAMNERSVMAIISPYLRRAVLDSSVDIEVTGPLRFLKQHDPLVAAQMRAFVELY